MTGEIDVGQTPDRDRVLWMIGRLGLVEFDGAGTLWFGRWLAPLAYADQQPFAEVARAAFRKFASRKVTPELLGAIREDIRQHLVAMAE